jgi:hypothetical protein
LKDKKPVQSPRSLKPQTFHTPELEGDDKNQFTNSLFYVPAMVSVVLLSGMAVVLG